MYIMCTVYLICTVLAEFGFGTFFFPRCLFVDLTCCLFGSWINCGAVCFLRDESCALNSSSWPRRRGVLSKFKKYLKQQMFSLKVDEFLPS